MLSPKAYQQWKRGDLIVQVLFFLLTLIVESNNLGFEGAIYTSEFVIGIVQIMSTLLWFVLGRGYQVLLLRKSYYLSLFGWFMLCVLVGSTPLSFILLPIAGCMGIGYLTLTAIEGYRNPSLKRK